MATAKEKGKSYTKTKAKIENKAKTHINRIKIRGFKSFRHADLELPPGFIAVAGPNGSGKSNLSDAVRFSLGELSLKSLRARRTSELVFTDAKEAVVTLYAGDGNGKSIEVKRAINPDGKTIYRLNGKRTTRATIIDAIRPMGLELGNHNVIAQGQVQKIVEMNAKERRGILDGVAGIAEFEDKKKESLRELDKVQQKTNDASIVLNEREGFLTELEKEKDAALRYREAQDLFKRSRASLMHLELAKLERDYDKYVKALKELEGRQIKIKKDIHILENHIKELENKKGELTAKINKSKGRESLLKELENLRIALSVDEASLSEKEKEITRLKKELGKNEKEEKKLLEKTANLEKEVSNAQKELSKLEKNVPKEAFGSVNNTAKMQTRVDKLKDSLSAKRIIIAIKSAFRKHY